MKYFQWFAEWTADIGYWREIWEGEAKRLRRNKEHDESTEGCNVYFRRKPETE